jgi:N-acetylmuramoyl-L-alanine amidase
LFKNENVVNNQSRIFVGLILAVILGSPEVVFSQFKENSKKVVVIDPGHGGLDSGATGINGILEKDVVLKIAKEMVRYNQNFLDNAFEIYVTRSRDTLISLGDRKKLANTLNADIFISLHCNHSENPNAKGVEVYFFNRENEQTKESILLAYNIHKALQQNLGFKSRGVKFANFQVLRDESEQLPSVLVEFGFLSNLDEAMHMAEEGNIRALALSVLKSLILSK